MGDNIFARPRREAIEIAGDRQLRETQWQSPLSPAPERWRRVWVFIVPIALFAVWYFVWRTTTPTLIPNTASDVFLFVRQSWVMLCATVTGLSGVLPIPVYRQPVAEVVGAGRVWVVTRVLSTCIKIH